MYVLCTTICMCMHGKGVMAHTCRGQRETSDIFLHCFLSHSTEIGLLIRYKAPCFPPWIYLCLPPTLGLLASMAMPSIYMALRIQTQVFMTLGMEGIGNHSTDSPWLQSPRKMWSCTLSQERTWAMEQHVVQQPHAGCLREAPKLKPSHTCNIELFITRKRASNIGGLCH